MAKILGFQSKMVLDFTVTRQQTIKFWLGIGHM